MVSRVFACLTSERICFHDLGTSVVFRLAVELWTVSLRVSSEELRDPDGRRRCKRSERSNRVSKLIKEEAMEEEEEEEGGGGEKEEEEEAGGGEEEGGGEGRGGGGEEEQEGGGGEGEQEEEEEEEQEENYFGPEEAHT